MFIMKIQFTLFLLLLFTFFVSHDAFARVYKCHDTNGKVVYKNAPCSEGQKSETVINIDRSGKEYDKSYDYENEDYLEPVITRERKVEDVKKISSGERVNLNNYVVKDKITAFLFYADWCHACEKIRPGVENMARNSDNFILRKIDITEFESPVTDQYQIKSIPYFYIYDESGELRVNGSQNKALNYLNNNI